MLLLVAVDDGREDTCQVAVWFDLVDFACFDEGRAHGPILRTCAMACEECVFTLQSGKRCFDPTFRPAFYFAIEVPQ